MKRKEREKPVVIQKELQGDLKVAGAVITHETINTKLHRIISVPHKKKNPNSSKQSFRMMHNSAPEGPVVSSLEAPLLINTS